MCVSGILVKNETIVIVAEQVAWHSDCLDQSQGLSSANVVNWLLYNDRP